MIQSRHCMLVMAGKIMYNRTKKLAYQYGMNYRQNIMIQTMNHIEIETDPGPVVDTRIELSLLNGQYRKRKKPLGVLNTGTIGMGTQRLMVGFRKTNKCSCFHIPKCKTEQSSHNELDGVSDHQPHDCILNRLFRRRSKKISKLRVTDLCAGNSPLTGEFPAQKASNAENVSFDDVIMHWSYFKLSVLQQECSKSFKRVAI